MASTSRPARKRTPSRAAPSTTAASSRTGPRANCSRSVHAVPLLGPGPRRALDRRIGRQPDHRQHLPRERRRRHLPLHELRRVREHPARALLPAANEGRAQPDRGQPVRRRTERCVGRLAHERQHVSHGLQQPAVSLRTARASDAGFTRPTTRFATTPSPTSYMGSTSRTMEPRSSETRSAAPIPATTPSS